MQRGWVLGGAGVAVLVAGAWITCADAECAPGAFDRAGLAHAHALRSAPLDHAMALATWAGSLALLLPAAAIAAWTLHRAGRRRAAAFVPLALLSASALGHAAKLWLARPRPDLFPAAATMPIDWSYPSAHAMQATAFALAIFLAVRGGPRLALALAAAVVVVGASRVYLQVHFPTDVLFGTVGAALWVAGVHALLVPREAAIGRDEEGTREA